MARKFQSTLPREERLHADYSGMFRYNFNPRSHERSDEWRTAHPEGTPKEFQSTLPREERQKDSVQMVERGHFNPRSHERSDPSWVRLSIPKWISIHAPTRGATSPEKVFPFSGTYFNPRSHERSDRNGVLYFNKKGDFNPRSHERSDGDAAAPWCVPSNISIHAPTRGATSSSVRLCRFNSYFNPRSHERSDEMEQLRDVFHQIFQSTLPREERR